MIVDPRGQEELIDSLLKKFRAIFGEGENCLRTLRRIIAESSDGKCRYCGSRDIGRSHREGNLKCRACKRIWSLTSGTFFKKVRRADAWLGIIFFMDNGLCLSASRFQKLFNVSYSTAWKICRAVSMVIHNRMHDDFPLTPSGHFLSVVLRRTRETPARAHPASEEAAISGENGTETPAPAPEDNGATNICDTSSLSDREKELHALLSDKPIHFDIICDQLNAHAAEISSLLTMLELGGFATRNPGDWYVRAGSNGSSSSKHSAASPISGEAANFRGIVAFIRETYHGVGRKYLQHHLALHWFCFDRETWRPGLLLTRCLQFDHVSLEDILKYVTPPMVKFWMLPRQAIAGS